MASHRMGSPYLSREIVHDRRADPPRPRRAVERRGSGGCPPDQGVLDARGPLGGRRDRAVPARPGRLLRRRPVLVVVAAVPGLLRRRRLGAGSGRAAGAAREDSGR